jgi:hypothetical protein
VLRQNSVWPVFSTTAELLAWEDVLADLKRLLPNFFPDLIDRG